VIFFVFCASCWNHCLAALDLEAGVEQPFNCLIVQNRQALQSMGRSMDWSLEDNMVDGLFFCATRTGAEEAIPLLYKQERKRPTPVRRRLSRTQALLLGGSFRVGGCRCRGWKCVVLWVCPSTPPSVMIRPSVAIILVREKVLFFFRLNKSLITCQTFFAIALFVSNKLL